MKLLTYISIVVACAATALASLFSIVSDCTQIRLTNIQIHIIESAADAAEDARFRRSIGL